MRLFYQKEFIHKAKRPRGPRRVVTQTYSRLTKLSDHRSNMMKVDLIDGIKSFKKKISVEELTDAWRSGDYGAVMAAVPWNDLPSHLDNVLLGLGETVDTSAKIQLEKLPPNINENLRFDLSNPHLRSFIGKRTASLVTGVRADTQEIIRNAVSRSFSGARTPRQVAEQIRGSIGLYPQQEKALDNFRMGLLDQNIGEKQFNNLSNAYEDRLLDYRSMMIARSETRMAVHEGQLAVWQQAANQGLIDKKTAKKEWIVDGDPCETCISMDGVQVGLDEPWMVEYPDGSMEALYTPFAHPHCMCGQELHFGQDKETDDEE